MGVWLMTAVASGLAVLGLSMGLMTLPATERPVREGVLQESTAQARVAFEYLVREYLKRNSTFVGTLHASDLSAAGVTSASLANGSFSPSWSATVATGGAITFCAAVPSRAMPLLLKKGFALESLTCGN